MINTEVVSRSSNDNPALGSGKRWSAPAADRRFGNRIQELSKNEEQQPSAELLHIALKHEHGHVKDHIRWTADGRGHIREYGELGDQDDWSLTGPGNRWRDLTGNDELELNTDCEMNDDVALDAVFEVDIHWTGQRTVTTMGHKSLAVIAMLCLCCVSQAEARMTPCDSMPDCGSAAEHAVAGMVRSRELTTQERALVITSWLAINEYLTGALEFVREHPGSTRAPLPLPSDWRGVPAAMNALLAEVSAHGQPRSSWIDSEWERNRLATHVALLVWGGGVVHARIPQLARSDGYLPSDYEACDSLCRYYRMVASEPTSMQSRVLTYLGKQGVDATAAFVRLAELGPAANDAALQLYQSGWPGVAQEMQLAFTERLYHLLIKTGDSRASQIEPKSLSEASRAYTPARSGVPAGTRALKSSLAYLVYESQMNLVGPETRRAQAQAP